jgi:hypothetical protein
VGTFVPLQQNKIDGTCDDAVARRKAPGVVDYRGEYHAEHAGWTCVEFSSSRSYTWDMETKKRYRCEVDGTMYDSAAECQANCQPTLGNFTQSGCTEVDETTVVAQKISVKWRRLIKVTALRWNPPKKSGRQCRKEATNWNDRVREHENQHVRDALRVYARMVEGWKLKMKDTLSKVSATSEDELRANIDREIAAAIQQASDEIKRLSDAYHQQVGPIRDPDCSKCP